MVYNVPMRLDQFDFPLPPERIARFPADRRDESRLLRLERASGRISHHHFRDLPELLAGDEFLVVNNSRVTPARFFGRVGGRRVEFLVTRETGTDLTEVLGKPGKVLRPGAQVEVAAGVNATVAEVLASGKRILRWSRPFAEVRSHGYAPLPPYLHRASEEADRFRSYDLDRYQTVYARTGSSIAAPTAGLHFTPELLARLREKCPVIELTLDVGEATFQKIEAENVEDHRMGRETIHLPHETRRQIETLRGAGRKLLAVGTTSVRSLETWARDLPAGETFDSEIFIYPGFSFQRVDRLVTNFHLPKSSLFILTSAFAGLETLQEAYRIAIQEGYRFFSYGDAMLIV